MSLRYAIFALTFVYSGAATASELGELAASMAPGTFAELHTGLTGDFLYTEGAAHSTLAFADSANWDPNSHRFSFLGSPHGAHDKFIVYDEATNSWQSGPVPCGTDCFPHAWDHNAMNPATGDAYFRIFGGRDVYKLLAGAAQWTKLPSIPTSALAGIHCCGGLEFFPELGGLVYADGWGVALFDEASSQWTGLHGDFGLQYQSFIEYNPVHQLMLIGGGTGPNDLFKLDAAGQLSQLGAPPVPLGITQSIVAVDPVTGLYLVYDNQDLYQYDVSTDAWGKLEVTVPNFRQDSDGSVHVVEAAIPAHGVVMFVTSHNSAPSTDGAKVYLYKHAPCDSCAPGGGSGGATSGGSGGASSGGSSGSTSPSSGAPASGQGQGGADASGSSAGGATAEAGKVGGGAGGALQTPSAAPAASAAPGADAGCSCRHATPSRPPGFVAWLFSVAMAVGLARRRRRSERASVSPRVSSTVR